MRNRIREEVFAGASRTLSSSNREAQTMCSVGVPGQIILNTLDHPHGIGCKINLTDLSLTYLLSHCQRLELIGDLSRWSLVDFEETERCLRRDWAWTKYT